MRCIAYNAGDVIASKRVSQGIGFVVATLVLSILGCALMPTAPNRPVPSPPSPKVAVELLEIPESACLGEVVAIRLRTRRGNKCDAHFLFRIEDKQSTDFLTQVADSEGICLWRWEIPGNASSGNVQIYLAVHFDDIESNYLVPQIIQIHGCEGSLPISPYYADSHLVLSP